MNDHRNSLLVARMLVIVLSASLFGHKPKRRPMNARPNFTSPGFSFIAAGPR
jgi:hypothetical protein